MIWCTLGTSPVDKPVLGIAAHDAGAANVILEWWRSGYLDEYRCSFFLSGPAARLALNDDLHYASSASALVATSSTILVGTGWQTDFEKEVMKLGLQKKKDVYAVFDHWTNYKSRLILKDQDLNVSQIWVTDEWALQLARKNYPNKVITLHPNFYLQQRVSEIHALCGENTRHILFLMEPIRNANGVGGVPELDCFRYFIRYYRQLESTVPIVIRPHPSDTEGKYDALVSEFDDVLITIDDDVPLSLQIAQSEFVVGIQSYALVIALEAGKSVISSIPPELLACVLPHQEILHLREMMS